MVSSLVIYNEMEIMLSASKWNYLLITFQNCCRCTKFKKLQYINTVDEILAVLDSLIHPVTVYPLREG